MKKQGKAAGEAWEICHEALRLRMKQFPKIKRWLLGRIMRSGILIKRMRKLAETGKQPRFGDFEVRYVIGDGKEFWQCPECGGKRNRHILPYRKAN